MDGLQIIELMGFRLPRSRIRISTEFNATACRAGHKNGGMEQKYLTTKVSWRMLEAGVSVTLIAEEGRAGHKVTVVPRPRPLERLHVVRPRPGPGAQQRLTRGTRGGAATWRRSLSACPPCRRCQCRARTSAGAGRRARARRGWSARQTRARARGASRTSPRVSRPAPSATRGRGSPCLDRGES